MPNSVLYLLKCSEMQQSCSKRKYDWQTGYALVVNLFKFPFTNQLKLVANVAQVTFTLDYNVQITKYDK